jgi:hypothetical protein
MAGTIHIDSAATFSAMLLMSAGVKTKFGTDQPDISSTGERKYTVSVACTYNSEFPGMRAQSEVIEVTVTGGADPSASIPPGTGVEFDRLRCGFSAPEKRDDGRLRGGRPYFMASGVRAVHGQRGKSEAA